MPAAREFERKNPIAALAAARYPDGMMTNSQFDRYYQALIERDPRFDGEFVYAVKTTGVYCRPVCASRAPLRRNVEFFASAGEASAAAYRPCKRCKPDSPAGVDERFVRVCRAIEDAQAAPALRDLAALAGMSEFHLQRRFKAALGVSPRQYASMVKRERLRGALRAGGSIAAAIYDAGFGSASVAYGESRDFLGMTPSQFRAGGKGMHVVYAIVSSPLGFVLIAATQRGICRVDIAGAPDELETRLRNEFPKASLVREDDSLQSAASLVVAYLSGKGPWPLLPLDVRATAFQTRVWDALRAIAPGTTTTYSDLASAIGSPKAARAVARACASNPVALLIPCHRVLPKSGGTGGYRWDPERKQRLIEIERAKH